jgi:hypothetical protein
MTNLRNRFPARRRFLKQSAALTASASIAAPVMALASARQPDPADPAGADAPAADLRPAQHKASPPQRG